MDGDTGRYPAPLVREYDTYGGTDSCWEGLDEDADLIAHAPADIAWLLSELDRVSAERDDARTRWAELAIAQPHPTLALLAGLPPAENRPLFTAETRDAIAAQVRHEHPLVCDCCCKTRDRLPFHHDAHDDSGDSWDYCQSCDDAGCELVSCALPRA